MKTKTVVALLIAIVPVVFLLTARKNIQNRPSDLRDAPNSAVDQLSTYGSKVDPTFDALNSIDKAIVPGNKPTKLTRKELEKEINETETLARMLLDRMSALQGINTRDEYQILHTEYGKLSKKLDFLYYLHGTSDMTYVVPSKEQLEKDKAQLPGMQEKYTQLEKEYQDTLMSYASEKDAERKKALETRVLVLFKEQVTLKSNIAMITNWLSATTN